MNNKKQKSALFRERIFVLVGEGGFEPPKLKATDLQSAPFGRSGILPYSLFQAGIIISQLALGVKHKLSIFYK